VRTPGYKGPVLSFIAIIALERLVETDAWKGVCQKRRIKVGNLVRSPFDVHLVLSRVLAEADQGESVAQFIWTYNPGISYLLAQHDQTSERRVDRFSRGIQGFYGICPSKSAGRRGPWTCGLQGHHEMSGTYVGDRCGCNS
jgi:hypothetical protein